MKVEILVEVGMAVVKVVVEVEMLVEVVDVVIVVTVEVMVEGVSDLLASAGVWFFTSCRLQEVLHSWFVLLVHSETLEMSSQPVYTCVSCVHSYIYSFLATFEPHFETQKVAQAVVLHCRTSRRCR